MAGGDDFSGTFPFYCPRNGAKWFTCTTGSRFVGCCKHDPCKSKSGCSGSSLVAAYYNTRLKGEVTGQQCKRNGSSFYTCDGTATPSFIGCCKSNPCQSRTCPEEALDAAYLLDDDSHIQQWMPSNYRNETDIDSPATTVTAAISSTASPAITTDPQVGHDRASPKYAIAVVASGLVAMLLICIILIAWLVYRQARRKFDAKADFTVQVPLTKLSKANILGDDTQRLIESNLNEYQGDIDRLGSPAIATLLTSTVIVIGFVSFFIFLWFGREKNSTWRSIMIRGWATRTVSISALVLRTAVDFQAAIASAIIASLLLESRHGIHVFHVAKFSQMRSGLSDPWSLAREIIAELWHARRRSTLNALVIIMAIFLLITTSLLQLSSTLLLSDLTLGSLGAPASAGLISTNFYYQCSSIISGGKWDIKGWTNCGSVTYSQVPRDRAWVSNPPFYPTFGEYTEPPEIVDGVSDTGTLLRAMLPFDDAQSRETLRNYTGKTVVVDARVSCQAPNLMEFSSEGHYGRMRGIARHQKPVKHLQKIVDAPFLCSNAGPGQYSICQLGLDYPFYAGSLQSSFSNMSADNEIVERYGATFLVIRGLDGGQWIGNPRNQFKAVVDGNQKEWLNILSNFTNKPVASMSLCFAPWDSTLLDVNLYGNTNRTEPTLRWDPAHSAFDTSEVSHQLLPDPNNIPSTRSIMKMSKPVSLTPLAHDALPWQQRPLVQGDPAGYGAVLNGANVPFPPNITIILARESHLTLMNHFESTSTPSIGADPALASIFLNIMETNKSLTWAMSSILTVISTANYYGQRPAFNRQDNVTTAFFTTVLFPQQYQGLILLTWTLVGHFAIIVTLVMMFISRTKLTLLGNAWAAHAQAANSQDLKKLVEGKSLVNDDIVLTDIQTGGEKANLRARVVERRTNDGTLMAEIRLG